MFALDFSTHAEKFLKKSEKELAKRLVERIEKLAIDPFPKDVKRIVNRKEKVFRVRVGDYRIQYFVNYEKNLISITDIDERSKAY
ncbi:hypothetical protein COV18_00340 [Candidatus Woesearchaeota archaeon CG10_big_fil_rev_8_21_14_0_10_37_12]|nr:MAG: hypothetical protein COV18_00340 [Candidatus Woesearchaeota archaeon CG10_big_fil_rev_8_21_14_0_10_37_12]